MERLGRVDMLLELLENDPKDLFLNYALGIEYASVLSFTEAETQFKTVLDINNNYVPVYYQLGKLSEARSDTKQALEYYKTGLDKARQQKDKSVESTWVIRLEVDDLRSAKLLIERELARAGANMAPPREQGAGRVLRAQLDSNRLPALLSRLARIGRILEQPDLPDKKPAVIILSIRW